MFPLKDNIPTLRFPAVTVALIALNVFVYFFWLQGGLSLGMPEQGAYVCHLVQTHAVIPCEITTRASQVGSGLPAAARRRG